MSGVPYVYELIAPRCRASQEVPVSHLLPHSRLLRAVMAVIAIAVFAEAYNSYTIYRNAVSARDSLLAIQDDIDIGNLGSADAQVAAARPRLQTALDRTKEARASISHD